MLQRIEAVCKYVHMYIHTYMYGGIVLFHCWWCTFHVNAIKF